MNMNDLMSLRTKAGLSVLLLVTVGCGGSVQSSAGKKESGTSGPGGIKWTDDIGEFQAKDGQEVVEPKVKVSASPLYAVEAYEPLKETVAEFPIIQAVQFFQAEHGRYPKDHAEFMEQIIKRNNIRLPALSAGKRYQYDVQNHKLVIVKDAKPAEPAK